MNVLESYLRASEHLENNDLVYIYFIIVPKHMRVLLVERHSIKSTIYCDMGQASAGVAPVQIQDVTAKLREFTDKVSPETGAQLVPV